MSKKRHFLMAALAAGFVWCSGDSSAWAAPHKDVVPSMATHSAEPGSVAGLGNAFSSGPAGTVSFPTPRGGSDVIHSGLPACDDLGVCDLQVGVTGDIDQECGDDEWTSLAWPVATNGATITAVNITFNSNDGGGDLYLMDDCGENPNVNSILYSGCNQILAGDVGSQTYPVGAVTTGATTWVVAVFRSSFSFSAAYNSTVPGTDGTATGLGFGNLSSVGAIGEWQDLADFAFGFCYCVSLETGSAGPACCDSPALCDGDVNGSGNVDPLDSGFVQSRFGLDVTEGDNCVADVNCDGVVDPLDDGYIKSRFGLCNPVPPGCAPGGGECGGGGGGDPPPPPANDSCSSATVVLEGSTPFDNNLATTDGPGDCDPFTGNNDLWYHYTATSAGTLLASLCTDTNYDSTLSVYNGTGCPVGASLACSDDDCGVVGGGSEVTVAVTNGQTVKIRVGGWDEGDCATSNPTGTGTLFLDLVPNTQGACCFEDETCSINSSAGCTGAGGVFQGNGSACTSELCEIAGLNDTCDGAVILSLSIGETVGNSGDSTDATADCSGLAETWEAFTTTEVADVEVDYCGTPGIVFDINVFIQMMTDCGDAGECGGFSNVGSFGVQACGDGLFSPKILFEGLPAGTYWYPVLADTAQGGIAGPYTINFTAEEPSADCCEVHASPGCEDPVIEACVCAADDFCCNVTWDEACVDLVELLGCGSCTPGCENADPPADACECAPVEVLSDNETVTFLGDTTNAEQECDALGADLPEVWLAWSQDVTDRVFIDYCGTETPFDFLFIVIDNSCPCDGSFVFGTQVTVTCDDGTTAAGLRFTNLPAGTYYYPLLAGDLGVDGPYSMRIGRR